MAARRLLCLLAFAFGLGLATAACSGSSGPAPATRSAERLVEFVQTGDSLHLAGVFTDSLLGLMSIEEMVATRNDFLDQFGDLLDVEGPTFDSDSTAAVTLNYERMSLLAELEFTPQGSIRFLSVGPAPLDSAPGEMTDSNLTDVRRFATLREPFNADSQYVRLVTILSPT